MLLTHETLKNYGVFLTCLRSIRQKKSVSIGVHPWFSASDRSGATGKFFATPRFNPKPCLALRRQLIPKQFDFHGSVYRLFQLGFHGAASTALNHNINIHHTLDNMPFHKRNSSLPPLPGEVFSRSRCQN